jgi:uncharacterized membrane protein YidH (DUF202 family)
MKRELVGVPRERITLHASGLAGSVTPRSVEELTGGPGKEESGETESDDSEGESAVSDGTSAGPAGATPDLRVEQPSWLQNVRNAIPVEILVVWAAIESAPGLSDGALGTKVFESQWLTLDAFGVIFGVMCVVTALYMWTDVESPAQAMADRRDVPLQYLRHSQYAQIVLAVGGFAVWAYYLGGPFADPYADAYVPAYATILLPLYVGLGPKLVPDLLRKLHGVEIPDERQRAPDEFLRARSD